MSHCGTDGEAYSHKEAERICAAAGRRLCTNHELAANACCRRGCALDLRFVWTQQPCAPRHAQPRTRRHEAWWQAKWAIDQQNTSGGSCPRNGVANHVDGADGFGSMLNKSTAVFHTVPWRGSRSHLVQATGLCPRLRGTVGGRGHQVMPG